MAKVDGRVTALAAARTPLDELLEHPARGRLRSLVPAPAPASSAVCRRIRRVVHVQQRSLAARRRQPRPRTSKRFGAQALAARAPRDVRSSAKANGYAGSPKRPDRSYSPRTCLCCNRSECRHAARELRYRSTFVGRPNGTVRPEETDVYSFTGQRTTSRKRPAFLLTRTPRLQCSSRS